MNKNVRKYDLGPEKQGHIVAATLCHPGQYLCPTQTLRAENESTFGKHDQANSVAAAQGVLVLPDP